MSADNQRPDTTYIYPTNLTQAEWKLIQRVRMCDAGTQFIMHVGYAGIEFITELGREDLKKEVLLRITGQST